MKSPQDCVVWYQVNYAPTTNLETRRPIAGLAVVRACKSASSDQETDPTGHTFDLLDAWLVNTPGGSPEHWDQISKLCHYREVEGARKTCVGVNHFALLERRIGTINRCTYWQRGVADPIVKEWDNPETEEDGADWRVVTFSKHHFPYALHQRTQVDLHGDGSLARVLQRFRAGMAKLGTMTLDTTDEESRNYNAGPDTDCLREEGAIAVSRDHCRVFCRDWEGVGEWVRTVEDNQGNPEYAFFVPDDYDNPGPFEIGTAYRWGGAGLFSWPTTTDSGGNVQGFSIDIGDLPTVYNRVASSWTGIGGTEDTMPGGVGYFVDKAGMFVPSGDPFDPLDNYHIGYNPQPHNMRIEGTGGGVELLVDGSSVKAWAGFISPRFNYTRNEREDYPLPIVFPVAQNRYALESVFDTTDTYVTFEGPLGLIDVPAPQFGELDRTGDYLDDANAWNRLAFPGGAVSGSKRYDRWRVHRFANTVLYGAELVKRSGVWEPFPPKVERCETREHRINGTWYDTNGVRHETGALCVAGRIDDLTPTLGDATAGVAPVIV